MVVWWNKTIQDERKNDKWEREEEWNTVGTPVSDSLGIKAYFITIGKDSNFLENVKNKIDKKKIILVMCAAGGRSMIAAGILDVEGYSVLNISDGFSGNGQDPGWKNSGLPSIIDNWFLSYIFN